MAAAGEYMPPSYLKTLRALMPSDPEYGHVEYLLKLALHSAAVRVLSIHALHTAEDNVRFEREHQGSVVLDSWCSTAALPDENNVTQLASHGGRFRMMDPSKGVLFPTGAIRIHPGETGPESRPPGALHLEFLHLRLAVGRAYVVERDWVARHPVPEGYESLKVHKEGEDDAGAPYYHEYILNDEQRVWPAFIVNLVYDPEDDRRGLAGMHHRVASWRQHCYQEAYSTGMDDLERERRAVDERRRTIHRQLQSIDERMGLVTRNHEHAQNEIYHVVQQVVQLLHSRTQAKLKLLLSDDAELRRQLQYFDWLEGFLAHQRALLDRSLIDPVEFLQNAQRHRDTISDAPSEIVDSYQTVHADIKVVGNLTVQIDDRLPPPPPQASHPAAAAGPPLASQPGAAAGQIGGGPAWPPPAASSGYGAGGRASQQPSRVSQPPAQGAWGAGGGAATPPAWQPQFHPLAQPQSQPQSQPQQAPQQRWG